MRLLVFVSVMIFTNGLKGQIPGPAIWEYSFSDSIVTLGEEVELIFKVTLDENWYIYSTDFKPADFGPIPTKFEFEPHPSYVVLGEVQSIGAREKVDDLFGLTFRYMDQSPAVFSQNVRIRSKDPVIRGTFQYQVCSLVDGKCILRQGDFDFRGLHVAPLKRGKVNYNNTKSVHSSGAHSHAKKYFFWKNRHADLKVPGSGRPHAEVFFVIESFHQIIFSYYTGFFQKITTAYFPPPASACLNQSSPGTVV